MRRWLTMKAILLLAIVITSSAGGWLGHSLSQSELYRKELKAGLQLRSTLSEQLNNEDELESLKIQQETAHWELTEHRQRIEIAKDKLRTDYGVATLGSGRNDQ
jgi:hypothetical protein